MASIENRIRKLTPRITPKYIESLLAPVIGPVAVRSADRLTCGMNNLLLLLTFVNHPAPYVLRLFVRDIHACQREAQAIRLLSGIVPVPDIVALSPASTASEPFMLYRFVDGQTFNQIKTDGDPKSIAQASYALGHALALIEKTRTTADQPRHLPPHPGFDETVLQSPLLRQRLGHQIMARLMALFSRWQHHLEDLAHQQSLTHGDFNGGNAIFERRNGAWRLAAIIDWEYASLGSSLWDAARFLCYERMDNPCREPFFSLGFRDGGGYLPPDWLELSAVLNTLSAARSLTLPETQQRFVPELINLVADCIGRP